MKKTFILLTLFLPLFNLNCDISRVGSELLRTLGFGNDGVADDLGEMADYLTQQDFLVGKSYNGAGKLTINIGLPQMVADSDAELVFNDWDSESVGVLPSITVSQGHGNGASIHSDTTVQNFIYTFYPNTAGSDDPDFSTPFVAVSINGFALTFLLEDAGATLRFIGVDDVVNSPDDILFILMEEQPTLTAF